MVRENLIFIRSRINSRRSRRRPGDGGKSTSVFWTRRTLWLLGTLLDFLIKIVSDGLIFTPTAYFSSMWNILDTLVLCVDVVIVMANRVFIHMELVFQRAINVLVSLRMFRVLSRNKMQRRSIGDTDVTFDWVRHQTHVCHFPGIRHRRSVAYLLWVSLASATNTDVTQSVSSSTYVTKTDIDQYSCDLREDTYWNSPKYDFDWIGRRY